jgi:hypothetical protein
MTPMKRVAHGVMRMVRKEDTMVYMKKKIYRGMA